MRNHPAKRRCSLGSAIPMTGTMIAVSTSVRSGMGQPTVSGNMTRISRLISG